MSASDRQSKLTVPFLLQELSDQYGDLPAVIDSAGIMTFRELNQHSSQMAAALLSAGLSKGARVGILMPNGQNYLVALMGILRMGGVAVLISTLSKPPELAQLIRTADIDTLLCADNYLRHDYVATIEEALPGLHSGEAERRLSLSEAPFLRSIWIWGHARPAWASVGADILREKGVEPWISLVGGAGGGIVPSDAGVIIFTSGSSAEPKAIVHSHANLVRQGQSLAELMGGCGPGDRILSTMPFFWVGGLCTVVLAALCSGTAVICPPDQSASTTIEWLRVYDATHIMHWPQQLDLMKDNPKFCELLDKMRPAYAHQFELFGLAPPELNANTLGMTETLGPHSMSPPGLLPANKIGSFGLPVGGIERRIVDPHTGEELPRGNFGRLCLRGGSLMIGMHRKAFDEVFDDLGYYHTDDIAKIDEDGHLFFAGRSGDIVKISGANVSPAEVEGVIRTLDGVKATCVVGVSPPKQGEALAAAIIPEDGAELTPEALRDQLKSLLSSYKIPKYYVIMPQEDLPMTGSGKVYKPALKTLLVERLFGQAGPAA
jgi:acyl-CoA synthetase (AMP-forming)/AMP-acid ligase II